MRADAGGFEDRGDPHPIRHGEREQQHFAGDEFVFIARGQILGGVQHFGGVGVQVELPVPALNLGDFAQFDLHVAADAFGVAAGGFNQGRRAAFGVVEQHFQKMLGRETLMAFAHGEALTGLDEAPGPVGEFFHIHGLFPNLRRTVKRGPMTRRPQMSYGICKRPPQRRRYG